MRTVRYITQVDPDVKYPPAKFAGLVEMYLSDPDGWESRGYKFEEVKSNPEVVIHLSSPATLQKVGCEAGLSCAELGGKHLRVNAMRWMNGAKESRLELENYRQYLISHEMGHILGFDHVKCPGPGQPAPIMMQQTRGIGQCKTNTALTLLDGKY